MPRFAKSTVLVLHMSTLAAAGITRDLGRTGVPPFVPRYVSVRYVPYGPDRARVASSVLYRYRTENLVHSLRSTVYAAQT